MTIVDEIFEDDIIAKLETIVGVSVLDGFLVHYAKDLLTGENGLSFPCVAAQLDNETVDLKQGNTEGVMTRIVKLIGAVSASDKVLVNRKLNDLVFKVRQSLCIDKYNATEKRNTKSKSIDVGGVIFTLPEVSDQYAYFEMTITLKYVEKWK